MKLRQAIPADAAEISAFLQALTALGKRTNRSDIDFVASHYINNPNNIQCTVAEDTDGTLLGLQSLTTATPGNIYGVTPGWGIIGTHVNPTAARRGVGRALFTATRTAAQAAGLQKIDASIAATNTEGLAYYDSIGFRTYRTPDGKICKCYAVER